VSHSATYSVVAPSSQDYRLSIRQLRTLRRDGTANLSG